MTKSGLGFLFWNTSPFRVSGWFLSFENPSWKFRQTAIHSFILLHLKSVKSSPVKAFIQFIQCAAFNLPSSTYYKVLTMKSGKVSNLSQFYRQVSKILSNRRSCPNFAEVVPILPKLSQFCRQASKNRNSEKSVKSSKPSEECKGQLS